MVVAVVVVVVVSVAADAIMAVAATDIKRIEMKCRCLYSRPRVLDLSGLLLACDAKQ